MPSCLASLSNEVGNLDSVEEQLPRLPALAMYACQ